MADSVGMGATPNTEVAMSAAQSEAIPYRLPEAFEMGSEYNFTVEHGTLMREKYGGFTIPDFQRGLVWTEAQKVLFVESLILKLPVGSYCYHEIVGPSIKLNLLDGQQRWSAIFGYVDNEFPVFGFYFSDLNEVEVRFFMNRGFSARVVRGLTYDQQKEVFERLAYGGTPNVRPDSVERQESSPSTPPIAGVQIENPGSSEDKG